MARHHGAACDGFPEMGSGTCCYRYPKRHGLTRTEGFFATAVMRAYGKACLGTICDC